MSKELKVGDKVTVNGEEYELRSLDNSAFLYKLPQKSELEKFVENYHQVNGLCVNQAMEDTAFALLKHLAKNLDSCLTSYQLFTVASKWCGK